MRNPFTLIAVIMIASTANSAHAFDIRDCQLNKLTFVDPWGGDEFAVTKVFTTEKFECGDEWLETAKDESCTGPFGEVLLEGEITGADTNGSQKAVAVYSTYQASPCCGWGVYAPQSDYVDEIMDQAREIGKDTTLRNYPFASIDNEDNYYGNPAYDFGNEKYAMICRD